METTNAAPHATLPAHALKAGDVIDWTFRGSSNKLGKVEVFDAYPVSTTGRPGRLTQLVLLNRSTGRTYHRQASADLEFRVTWGDES